VRYVAVFCHAFKSYPNYANFRIGYKILDPHAGVFLSVCRGPVRSMAGVSPNTPHCLAVMAALKDPCLDKLKHGTTILLFNVHRLIHQRIDKHLEGKRVHTSSPFSSFEKSVKSMCDLISPANTISAWLNSNEEHNPLAHILKNLNTFRNPEAMLQENVYVHSHVINSLNGVSHELATQAYERITRSKNLFNPDDYPFDP